MGRTTSKATVRNRALTLAAASVTDSYSRLLSRRALACAVAAVAGTLLPHDSLGVMEVTIEAPGVQTTSVSGASIQTFDSWSLGTYNSQTWSGVGTYSSFTINAADVYGGANATRYLVAERNGNSASLSLNSSCGYFGMWFSAADAQNIITFRSGGANGTVVGRYSTADLSGLTAAYKGTPTDGASWNPGDNGGEYYVYVNFFGVGSTKWDYVGFDNPDNAGLFETDNHAVRTAGLDAGTTGPGTVTKILSGSTAYAIAQPSAVTSSVSLGNIRTSGTFSQVALSLSNTAVADTGEGTPERLDASFATPSGTATASGTVSLLAAGNTSTNLAVSLRSPQSAGPQSGSATILLNSNGQGTSGGGITPLPSQTVTVSGAAYDYANPTSLSSSSIAFGNLRPSASPVAQSVTVGNSTISNSAYQDTLDATLTLHNAKLGGAGFTGLAASASGATRGTLTVNANIAAAGSLADTANVNLTSNANSVAGLSNLALTGKTLTVTGGVYDYANPTALSSSSIAFGNLRPSASPVTQSVTVGNSTISNSAYQDSLDATLTLHNANLGGAGFTGLAASASGATRGNLAVNANIAAAGSLADTANVNLTSNANNVAGLSNLALTGKTFTVTGGVYDYANPTALSANTIAFGNLRPSASPVTQSVTIGNSTVSNSAYQDPLDATLTLHNAKLGGAGFTKLAASASGATRGNLTVNANIAAAGSLADTVNVNLTSDANSVAGLYDLALTGKTLTVTGAVYDYAKPTALPTDPIAFGNLRPSTTPLTQAVAVGNQLILSSDYQDSLNFAVTAGNDKLRGNSFIDLPASIGGQTTADLILTADLSLAGSLVDNNVAVTFTSNARGITGLSNTTLAGGALKTTGGVYDFANPVFDSSTINFGNVRPGATRNLAFTNPTITNAAYQDSLSVNVAAGLPVSLVATAITGTGIVAGGAGQSITFTATQAGPLSSTAHLNLVSNAVSGTGLSGRTTTGSVPITGGVYRYATGTLDTTTINFGNVHAGAAGPALTRNVNITNTAPADGYSDDLALNLTPITGVQVAANGSYAAGTGSRAAGTVTLDASAPRQVSGSVVASLNSVPTAGGLDQKSVGSGNVSISAIVYSGLSTWSSGSGGNWSNFGNWPTLQGAPGTDAAFTTTDTATFGSAIGTTPATITVNTPVSVKSVTFNNASAGYTVAGSNTLTLAGTSPALTDTSGDHTISAPVVLANNLAVNVNAGSVLTMSGSISGGSNGMTKSGDGVLRIDGNASYGGTTNINRGTLVVGGVAGGNVSVNSGGALLGGGAIGGELAVNGGGTVSPGEKNAAGQLSLAASAPGANISTLGSAGVFQWDVVATSGGGDQSASKGESYDYMTAAGILEVDSTPEAPFVIDVSSLSSQGTSGALLGWNPEQSSRWTILTADQGITGFSANKFAVDTANFYSFNTRSSRVSSFTVEQAGNSLYLVYTVPEPSSFMGGAVAAVAGLGMLRRRRQAWPDTATA